MEDLVTPSWFVVISYEILTSKELTDKEKLLMGLISSLQGQQGYCYANNAYLAEKLNCSPETVKDLISNLVKIGWLNRKIYRNDKNEFIKRILTIKLSKKDEIIEDAPPCKNPPTPPWKNPPTSVEKPPLLIDNINKVYLEVAKTKNLIELGDLPTLEDILLIANKVVKEDVWLEQICMSYGTTKKDMGEWMRAFNLHISNTEEIRGINDRKYKNLFIGWLRLKNSKGVKLSDFKIQKETLGKQLAPPLTR